VLGAIDLAAQLVLLPIDLCTFRLSQVTIVVFPVLANFAIQSRFSGFEPRRLTGREAARLNSQSD
jgi:hypothetical protein